MTGRYRFAGITVEIDSLYGDVHTLCRDYRADGRSEMRLRTTAEDIAFERVRSAREGAREGRSARTFSDGYLETLALYRQLAERLPAYGTVLFHGSCVAVDGAGYLFTARSGTGKSTHTRLWREMLGERAVMVNDDKPLLHIDGAGAVAFGTPWDGKHRLSRNMSVPLRALCLLTRAAENRIEPIGAAEAYPMLLQQVYRPLDSAALEQTLRLVDRLAASVSLWRLGCNMDAAAARIAFTAMGGEPAQKNNGH